MSYIGQGLPADTFQGFTTDKFTGDGTANKAFTLTKEPFSEDTILVTIDGVVQEPTDDFTVSGTTLTLVGTAANNAEVNVTHMGGPLPIGGAAELDLNGASDKLILDADGDTTISADTDDQIDIKIAGADDFQFTANTFTAQSGSTITTPTLGVGNTKDLGDGIHIKISDTGASTNTGFDELVIEKDGNCGISILSGNDDGGALIFGDDGDNDIGNIFYNHNGNYMAFNVNAAETFRIGSNGNIAVGNTDTTPAFGVTVADTRVTSGVCLDVHHNKTDTTFTGMVARFQSARNTTDGTYQHIRCAISGVANKFIVTDGGTIQAANTTVASVSDERIKQDIVDANSQWDDIKALKFKNFKKKQAVRDDGENALKELGVIAQDVESAGMSGLIEMTDPDISHIKSDSTFGTLWTNDDDEVKNGTETAGEVKEIKEKVKTVKYSMIWMKAVKALQEAQARIETLETKVKALEDA